jgi:hypothetical protein
LALPLGKNKWEFDSPVWHHLFRKSFQWKIEFENFHPRFISGWSWKFHLTWSFSNSTRGEEKPEAI